MATKWKNNKITEYAGILYVQNVINECKGIFNKIDGSNDIGLDGYLEFVQNEFATGLCVGVQIKSGNSFQNKERDYSIIKSDKAHFAYWKSHTLPIAGIVYVPADGLAYWIDITEFLKGFPQLIDKGPYSIRIKKDQIFDKDSFPVFYKNFSAYIEGYRNEWNLARSLKGLVDFKPKTERIDSIKALFYYHRDCKEAWYYLIQLFRRERDEDIQRTLIFTMKYLISHGDIFWHKNNLISEDIRTFGRSEIRSTFGLEELYKLLSHIDENGVSRGSIGQDIYPILDLIPEKYELLKKIILDEKVTDDIRSWAGVVAINDFQHYDLERAINFCDSMIDNFPNSENKEWFQNIKQGLEELGFVDFQG